MSNANQSETDRRFIETLRARLTGHANMRPVKLTFAFLYVAGIAFVALTFIRSLPWPPTNRLDAWMGLLLGANAGFLVVFLSAHLRRLLHAFRYQGLDRAEWLLLDYHDRLKALGALPAAPDRPDSRPSAGRS